MTDTAPFLGGGELTITVSNVYSSVGVSHRGEAGETTKSGT